MGELVGFVVRGVRNGRAGGERGDPGRAAGRKLRGPGGGERFWLEKEGAGMARWGELSER